MSNVYLSKTHYTKKEQEERQIRNYLDTLEYKEIVLDKYKTPETHETPGCSLLDSSLISQTKTKNYTHKIIQCGEYYQVYNYYDTRVKIEQGREKLRDEKKIFYADTDILSEDNEVVDEMLDCTEIDPDNLERRIKDYKSFCKRIDNKYQAKDTKEVKVILDKNIQRSKNQIQRLIKANENEFKTFITLTFAENEKRIDIANKRFNSWRTYIKRLKSDFKYICVPEFQDRGAVHYHLLTNIDYTDFVLLSKDEKKIWGRSSKKWEIGRTIVGWNKGYSMTKSMDNINVIGYLTKYLTKDLDNRLWGKRRYLYSLNLKQPSTIYIDESVLDENSKLLFIELFSDLKHENVYADKLGQAIEFKEYKMKVS